MVFGKTLTRVKELQTEGRLSTSVARAFLSKKPFRKLVYTKAYKKIYNKVIEKKTKNLSEHPEHFIIETTNYCNAKCIMCPHKTMIRSKGIMPMELFKKIVDDIVQNFQPKSFCVSGFGEPILDKELFEKIKYLKSKTNTKVKIFSNGALLIENNAKTLVESGLDEINISLNAANPESYKHIMGGLNYDFTLKNIANLLEEKQRQKSKKPFIALSLVQLKENEKEIQDFAKQWGSKVDALRICSTQNWAGAMDFGADFKQPKFACVRVWEDFYVMWNGQVTACCRDYEGKLVLGDLNNQTIKEVVNSLVYKDLQQKHLQGKIDEVEICKNCDAPLDPITWW